MTESHGMCSVCTVRSGFPFGRPLVLTRATSCDEWKRSNVQTRQPCTEICPPFVSIKNLQRTSTAYGSLDLPSSMQDIHQGRRYDLSFPAFCACCRRNSDPVRSRGCSHVIKERRVTRSGNMFSKLSLHVVSLRCLKIRVRKVTSWR